MKTFLLAAASLTVFGAQAQKLKLTPGNKITSVSAMTMNMDMGMAGQMDVQSTSTSVINVTGDAGDNYKAQATITKMKMSEKGAGQDMSYDSENPADTASEIGKGMAGMINKPTDIMINKTTGAATDVSPEKSDVQDDNPFASLMDNSKSPAGAAQAAFFIVPQGKKTGDKWMDSTVTNGLKVIRTMTLQGVASGLETIMVDADTKGTISKEAQGNTINIDLTGNSKSVITAAAATGLVKTNSTTGVVNGTMEAMGQSIPITININSSTTYQ